MVVHAAGAQWRYQVITYMYLQACAAAEVIHSKAASGLQLAGPWERWSMAV
jgi:hypothetical protein